MSSTVVFNNYSFIKNKLSDIKFKIKNLSIKDLDKKVDFKIKGINDFNYKDKTFTDKITKKI